MPNWKTGTNWKTELENRDASGFLQPSFTTFTPAVRVNWFRDARRARRRGDATLD